MHFRDDRRRRLLNEEILGAAARDEEAVPESPGRPAARRSARYAKAADMSNQPRITDLVPQRAWVLFLWCLLGLGAVAGLEALYWYMPQWARHTRDGRIAAFDLDGEGSLGAWFTSALLAASGLAAVLIYTLRRHRLDDYRGRYRLWLWAAACFFVMSIDEAGSLHEGFKEMMTHLTGERLAYDPVGDGSLWWVIAYAAVLGFVGLFIFWDLCESWLSGLASLATAGLYGVAVATQLGLLLPERGARSVMLEEGCEMLGAMMLLASLATYARHVTREIDGTAGGKLRKARRKTGKPAEARTATAVAKSLSSAPSVASAAVTSTSAASAATAGTKLEAKPGGSLLRKDPPHATPAPAGKIAAASAAKSKADRRR
jgi:hypothetical protein